MAQGQVAPLSAFAFYKPYRGLCIVSNKRKNTGWHWSVIERRTVFVNIALVQPALD